MMKNIIIIYCFFQFHLMQGQPTKEQLGAELSNFIEAQMLEQSIPGLAACIVKGDQIVWKDASGIANFETNTPVSLSTEFTLASISKLFTATACSQLWEQGLLDIDADINDYLPFSITNPNFPNEIITTRQLLQHKSSLHDFESDLQLWDAIGDPIYDLPTFCEAYFIAGGDLYNASNWGITGPGVSDYWYSNAGYTLLGYIVEVVSEMPFNEYCLEHILAPLQMNSAAWFYANLDTADVAMPYNTSFQPFGYFSVPEYPAAMLKANVEELANFLIAYTQRGTFQGQQLLNESTFEIVVPENMTNGFGWWGKDTWWGDNGGNFWSHGGFMNGVRTQLNYYPSDSTGLIILTNGEGSYAAIQNKLEAYIPLFQTDNTTALLEIESTSIEVFPNPISQQATLFVEFENIKEKEVVLYNLEGEQIYTQISKEKAFSLDLTAYPKGLYFLSIIENEIIQTKKLMIY